jgi:hypothetical protein
MSIGAKANPYDPGRLKVIRVVMWWGDREDNFSE